MTETGKMVMTLSEFAAEYHWDCRTFKKSIQFLEPQLKKLRALDIPQFTMVEIVFIRYKLGVAKKQKYTYKLIAAMVGADVDTFLYSWLKEKHYLKLRQLQPTRMKVLTPRQVDYLFSLFDVAEERETTKMPEARAF